MMGFTDELKAYVNGLIWNPVRRDGEIWPHEYISPGQGDAALFDRLVAYIRLLGHEGMLGQRHVTFFNDSGMIYWIVSDGVEGGHLVNRCSREQLWEYRMEYGALPEPRAEPASGSHDAETLLP